MALDTSIYFQNKNNVALANPLDMAAKAQNLQSLASQQKLNEIKVSQAEKDQQDQMALNDILKRNVVTDEKGQTSLNKGTALSEMYKSVPQKAMEFKKQFETDDIDSLMRQSKIVKQLAWEATPDNWTQTKQEAIRLGMKNAELLPDVYSPEFHQRWQMGSLAGEQQLQHRLEREKMDRLKEEDVYNKKRDLVGDSFRQKELDSKTLDRKEAREERRYQAGIIRDEKTQALATPYGQANSVDDAKQLKEGHEAKKNFDNKINQMIALREKHGGGAILDREDVERGKQLSKDALLEYKNMAKLGVLSKSDEDIINAIIPENPLKYNDPIAAVQGQDPILNRLKEFKKDSDLNFSTKVQTRTKEGINNPTNTKMINGQLYRKVDGGWLPASN